MAHEHFMKQATAAAVLILSAGVVVATEPTGRIVSIDGTAMVSQGGRYVTGSEGRTIQLGDRVMMLEGGRAAIWYGDTCEYFLLDDEVLDITESSPCATGRGGQLRPEIAEMAAVETTGAATEAVRFRLAQVGVDAASDDDEGALLGSGSGSGSTPGGATAGGATAGASLPGAAAATGLTTTGLVLGAAAVIGGIVAIANARDDGGAGDGPTPISEIQ
ncbi:hypothetical protein [Thiocapsa roseopersicina]|uniref:Uncharacterized protein n=1 Tax=Thiocapsa roseopersicina TaxID=1058 RepID=A0A1H2QDP7_THIRO|nr:hypothetical protein [Thiocapsa roseopersicina]SDW05377.1 hypothetical protein SAMN05421783_101234 [Thiocapsa roseopersicina]